MNIQTTRFGNIEIPDQKIIHFPYGLLGFEKEKRFALLPFAPDIDCPLEWLQSLNTPDLAFVVTDPFIYVPDYKLRLTGEEKRVLQIEPKTAVTTRAIVTIPTVHTDMTANLVAPLVINLDRMSARQCVLTTTEYDTRHYLLPQEVREGSKTPVPAHSSPA